MSIDPKSAHYDVGGIECNDYIKAKLTPEMYVGWLLGNILMYTSRSPYKGSFWRDIEKAGVYQRMLTEALNEDGEFEKIKEAQRAWP